LTGIKELFNKCNNVICNAVRAIMLNNKVKLLLVSFVRQIELQNFLIAPDKSVTAGVAWPRSYFRLVQKI